MKFDLEDLRYLLIWLPWELFLGSAGAVAGWPFERPLWGWFVVGVFCWIVYDARKDLML